MALGPSEPSSSDALRYQQLLVPSRDARSAPSSLLLLVAMLLVDSSIVLRWVVPMAPVQRGWCR